MDSNANGSGDVMTECRAALGLFNEVIETADGSLLVPTHYHLPNHGRIEVRVAADGDGSVEVDDGGALAAFGSGDHGAVESVLAESAGGEAVTYKDGTVFVVVDAPARVGLAVIAVAEAVADAARRLETAARLKGN
jgi:hypothetical protein